jgi:hypothetical protein
MNILQGVKTFLVTPPAARVDNAAFTTNTIDTAGYGKVAIFFATGATDIAMTVLKVTESDDSGMASPSDITGCVYGASGAPALPSASDGNKIYGFFINTAGRKRYFDVSATAGDGTAGTFGTCFAILYNGDLPSTALGRGLAANLIKD